MLITDAEIFCFELSDHDGNNMFFEIVSNDSLRQAINTAQKYFIDKFGHKAMHFENNLTGLPLVKI